MTDGVDTLLLMCNRRTFAVAKVLSVLFVFVCHLYQPFNNSLQFLIVSLFFFESGFGLEFSSSRYSSLTRLPRFIFAFAFFSLLYYFVYGVWFFPSAWFLLAYFMIMILYRFFSSNFWIFFLCYFFFSFFYYLFDFSYCYYVTPFAFVYGVFVARYMRIFTWFQSFIFFLIGLFAFVVYQVIFFIFFIPLYLRIILFFSSRRSVGYLSRVVFLVYPFFMSHCWILGLFDATWTLGGSFDLYASVLAFPCSVLFAYLLYRFVPFFSKRKFWIFQ